MSTSNIILTQYYSCVMYIHVSNADIRQDIWYQYVTVAAAAADVDDVEIGADKVKPDRCVYLQYV